MGVKLYKDCGYRETYTDLLLFEQILLNIFMDEISDDELEEMMDRKPTIREAKVDDHALMVKALEHPIRRKMIKSIGVFGKKRGQLKNEVGADDTIFNFQMDFLLKGNYLRIEGDNITLNDRGLVLLSNI